MSAHTTLKNKLIIGKIMIPVYIWCSLIFFFIMILYIYIFIYNFEFYNILRPWKYIFDAIKENTCVDFKGKKKKTREYVYQKKKEKRFWFDRINN